MTVENHWRLIKYDYLSEYNHACLDLLAYIIVTQVIPRQVDRLQQLRDGRAVTHWRTDLKIHRQEYYSFLRINEQYDNLFKDLPENLFLTVLNKLLTEYMLNEKALVNNNFDEQSSDYDTSNKEASDN
ncbi:8238_t:CDS:2 [Dentiscutata erythropus]|uniref:8238_t:CDS:1 n=1 Tax=Dentiscutata erythropus TaxID=1348616 RepID=A0A9N9G6Y7_9GLOM|nr:8238_t:CDS:2 [Dentiscutata erythropus]